MKRQKDIKINMGDSTRRLVQLVPIQNVKVNLVCYNLMNSIERKNYAKERSFHSALKQIVSLFDITTKLTETGWLRDADRININNLVLEKSFPSTHSIGYWLLLSGIRDAMRDTKKRSGAPKDYALDFLCFSLVYDLVKFTKRPHYALVSRFLDEQGVTNYRYTEEEIRKRFKRQSIDTIAKYVFYYTTVGTLDASPSSSTKPVKTSSSPIVEGCVVDCLAISQERLKRLELDVSSMNRT